MNQLQAMRVFIRVVNLASFSVAAKQLGMSAAAVTRHVHMLESHLNMRLLNRTTRHLSLTDAGREYLDGCRSIIEKLDEIEFNVGQTTRDPSGKLRLASPSTFASSRLGALLSSYRALHTKVDFEVTTFDTPIDPIEGGFDVCFMDDPHFTSSILVSRTLTRIDQVVVASPAYLAAHGVPKTPSSLNQHGLLAVTDGACRTWEFVNADGVSRVMAGQALSTSSSQLVRAAALNSMGIALLPREFVVDDLAQGRLVSVLKDYQINGGPRDVSILYSGRNYLSTKVRSFVDFVVNEYRSGETKRSLHVVA